MQSILFRSIVWFVAEICLTAIGTDDLADYCEYVFRVKDCLPAQQQALTAHVRSVSVCYPRNLTPKGLVLT